MPDDDDIFSKPKGMKIFIVVVMLSNFLIHDMIFRAAAAAAAAVTATARKVPKMRVIAF